MSKTNHSVKGTNKKRFPGLLVLLLLLLIVGGCTAKSVSENQSNVISEQVKYGDSSITVPAGMADKTASLSLESGVELDHSTPVPTDLDLKIIQNADLSLNVNDVTKAADKILALNKQSGGYTVSSHIYKNNDRISAVLSIKVPQQKLNSIITSISAFGEVTDKVITTQDVTEEYYDSKARLKVLQSKEERLLSLMNKAGDIEDIISIENELGKTRSEIEVLAGRLKYLTNATDYSLVNISLEQAVGGAVKAPQGTLGKSLQGLIYSLNQLIHFGSSLIVGFFIILPWAVLLTLLFLLVRYLYRKRKENSSKQEQ